ncbi:MAG: Ig-like domain repeat protein, partial [Clostridia bacterium]|nr:Ig-like domain repeat protein [Clostridia bacterium]
RSTATAWTKFGSTTTAAFKPSSAGTFNIRVYAKDNAGASAVKDFTVTAVAGLVNNSTVSKTSFKVGEAVTVKGAASGGSGTYTYDFYYKKSTSGTWTKFGSTTSATFKPSSSGTFTIRVYARDSAGNSSVKDFALTASK